MHFFKYEINKSLLPMKAHYFLWNAGTGPVVPFLSTYARQLGFSSVIVGLIYAILPICGMIAKPLVGLIADRFKIQKILFLAAIILTAVSFLAINYAPDVPIDRHVHFNCQDGISAFDTTFDLSTDKCLMTKINQITDTINCKMDCTVEKEDWTVICKYWNTEGHEASKYCNSTNYPSTIKFTSHINASHIEDFNKTLIFEIQDVTMENGSKTKPICPPNKFLLNKSEHISTTCNIVCDSITVNDIISRSAIKDEDVYGLYQFWVFLLLMISGWVGQAISVSVGDAICFELLGNAPNKYGYQRLFGSLGWGIFSIIAGFLVDAMSEGESKKKLTGAIYLAIAGLLVDFVVCTQIKYNQRKITTNIFRDICKLLANVRVIVFLLWCICIGFGTALIWNFLFWLIEDVAKQQGCESERWIKTLEGIVMAIQCLGGELPFFFLSGWILNRIGHTHAMSLVLLCCGIRFILYSVITNPWWFLPVEFSNGITFGLFYACMASYASIIAPPGTETTMQGLVGATFEGVGVALGSLLASQLYGVYGGPKTFRIFGIGALIACLIHAGVQYLLSRKGNSKHSVNKTQDSDARYSSPMKAIQKLEEQELTLIGNGL